MHIWASQIEKSCVKSIVNSQNNSTKKFAKKYIKKNCQKMYMHTIGIQSNTNNLSMRKMTPGQSRFLEALLVR